MGVTGRYSEVVDVASMWITLCVVVGITVGCGRGCPPGRVQLTTIRMQGGEAVDTLSPGCTRLYTQVVHVIYP